MKSLLLTSAAALALFAAPKDTGSAAQEPEKTAAEIQADEEAAAEQRDRDGAVLETAEGDGAIATAAGAVLTPTDTPVIDPTGWENVLIVANAPERMPSKKDRKVIVAEARTQPDHADGAGQFANASYPKNADAYVGHASVNEPGEAARIFPDAGDAPVFLMGQNVKQGGLGGVSRHTGYLNVGPGHPVCVAVNLALQLGAKTVEIHGLTDFDKASVGPWLDKVAHEFDTLSY